MGRITRRHSSWSALVVGLVASWLLTSAWETPCLHAAAASALGEAHEADSMARHLSSSTRYMDSLAAAGGPHSWQEIERRKPSPSCKPIYVYFLSRHGTREPTKKRIKQLNSLAPRLRALAKDFHPAPNDGSSSAKAATDGVSRCPLSWMKDFRSPWEGFEGGGELLPEGEVELYEIGKRMRGRFPSVFNRSYSSKAFPILATQVPRASASAVAFGLGLLLGTGPLGAERTKAFAVRTETADVDRKLRFHDICQLYNDQKSAHQPHIDVKMELLFEKIAGELSRMQCGSCGDSCGSNGGSSSSSNGDGSSSKGGPSTFTDEDVASPANVASGADEAAKKCLHPLTPSDVAGLWLLCKQEAAVIRRNESTPRACGVFSRQHLALLEWVEDVDIFLQKGYGRDVNFLMALPLWEDLHESLKKAAKNRKKLSASEAFLVERARMHFAHAETVIPFTCLLGLFQEDKGDGSKGVKNLEGVLDRSDLDFSSFASVISAMVEEFSNGIPPPPPAHRIFRGSQVAPLAANDAVVIFECGGEVGGGEGRRGREGKDGAGSSRRGAADGDDSSPDATTAGTAWAATSAAAIEDEDDDFGSLFVLTMHNERIVKLAGCGGKEFCPFGDFMSQVIEPHLRHSFEATCGLPNEPAPHMAPPGSGKPPTLTGRLASMVLSIVRRWLPSSWGNDAGQRKGRNEL